MKKDNRISLGQQDLQHLYELSLEHFQEGCFLCDKLKKRLEGFIGKKDVQRIKNNIRKNGYCKIQTEKDEHLWKSAAKDKFFKSYSKSDEIYDQI